MLKDDPIISCMEQTGYPPWHRDGDTPICPVCGAECTMVYKDKCNDIVGYDECLTPTDAADEEECFPRWDE